MKLQKLNQ